MINKKGITIIELLIAMSLLALLLGMVVGVYLIGANVFSSESSRSDVRQDAFSAMHTVVEKLREAKSITSASNTSVTFWVDGDWDGIIDGGETYVISWSGSIGAPLVMTAGGVAHNILEGVQHFNLSYDSAVVASIRHITITIETLQNEESIMLRSSVKPRNIFF
jgi:type II secretory pathway pseudopilin PulG